MDLTELTAEQSRLLKERKDRSAPATAEKRRISGIREDVILRLARAYLNTKGHARHSAQKTVDEICKAVGVELREIGKGPLKSDAIANRLRQSNLFAPRPKRKKTDRRTFVG
jgi:hypothetical protein